MKRSPISPNSALRMPIAAPPRNASATMAAPIWMIPQVTSFNLLPTAWNESKKMTDRDKRLRLRAILADSNGAIAHGVTDALFARLAEDCGYNAVHLSGNAIHKNFCLPDRNLLTATQIGQRIGQIADATDIPLIVDGGSMCAESIALTRAVKLYERAGTAALRFEDALVNEYGAAPEALAIAPISVVADHIKAAADARRDETLVLIARCDSR